MYLFWPGHKSGPLKEQWLGIQLEMLWCLATNDSGLVMRYPSSSPFLPSTFQQEGMPLERSLAIPLMPCILPGWG